MLPMTPGAERMTEAMRSLEAIFLIGVEGVTEIWLVRHGDCYQDMPEGRDPSLSKLGRDQAARLAERVRRVGFEAVYSSPYRRALETPRTISDDVKVDPRLVEMELELGEGDQFDMKETPEDTVERMRASIDEIVDA